jgi:hypothetical protein
MNRARMSAGVLCAALLGQGLFASRSAAAQATPDQPAHIETAVDAEARAATLATTLLPLTMTPSGGFTYGVVSSGYDGARGVAMYNLYADAKVFGALSVRAGYASPDLSGSGSALFGPRFQLFEQQRHGVDVGVALFYMPQNIYDEGLIVGRLSLGRRFGRLHLVGHVGYGQDPEGDDHQAEAAAGALFRIGNGCFIGFDGRVRALVATSDAKHARLSEPVRDAMFGPMLTYRLGLFAVVAQGGASALWIDQKPGGYESKVGAFGVLGASLNL